MRTRPEKESKRKLLLEYPLRCTPALLYRFIGTEAGLKKWFAEDVRFAGDTVTFFWGRFPREAVVLDRRPGRSVRFKWKDDGDPETYFEMRIDRSELTGDVSLLVTDFAGEEEYGDALLLWDDGIKRLRLKAGAAR